MFFEVKNQKSLDTALVALCQYLTENGVPHGSIFDSKLVVSELVGNVLRHSDGVATLHGGIKDGFVELKVLSTVFYRPPENSRCSDVYAESGRGLFIVDNVCAERIFTDDGGIQVRIKIQP